MEKFVIYNVDMHEQLAEFNSIKMALLFLEALYEKTMIDNLQVQRIRVDNLEAAEVEEGEVDAEV
jgi:hypothetical protein